MWYIYFVLFVGIALITTGHIFVVDIDFKTLTEAFGDAFTIAAVLAITVDKYIKVKLTKEIAHEVTEKVIKNAAHVIMNPSLPKELKDDLKVILETDIYRTEYRMIIELVEAVGNKDILKCVFSSSYRVHNCSADAHEFEHKLLPYHSNVV